MKRKKTAQKTATRPKKLLVSTQQKEKSKNLTRFANPKSNQESSLKFRPYDSNETAVTFDISLVFFFPQSKHTLSHPS